MKVGRPLRSGRNREVMRWLKKAHHDRRTGEELPRTEDEEKAQAAAVFYERYDAARQHPEYVRQRKLHRERYETTG